MKPSNHKSWATFYIALGIFLITISPFSQAKHLNILSGIAITIFGFIHLKK